MDGTNTDVDVGVINEAVTSVMLGLSTVYKVDNAARASYTHPLG
jgi:hypothetical protein